MMDGFYFLMDSYNKHELTLTIRNESSYKNKLMDRPPHQKVHMIQSKDKK